MGQPQISPYGSWKSPITSDLIVSGTIGLDQVVLDGADIYWMEGRPAEAGRSVIVRRTLDGRTADMTLASLNARTRVHEYGGGAYTVGAGIVYFSNFADQRLYRRQGAGQPEPLTPEGDFRYADALVDRRGRLICVREDHTASGREAVNTLVSIPLDGSGGAGRVLVSGNDFYSSPRLSPDGKRLAWLTWNHPNMPWDGTELWTGELSADGTVGQSERVAGGVSESVFQPEWSPDCVLHFVSDRSGWWNLYRLGHGRAEPLCPLEAEFARPQWVCGMGTYVVDPSGRIYCTYAQNGTWQLASLDPQARRLEPIKTPYTEFAGGSAVRLGDGSLVFVGGSPTEPMSVVRLDLAARKTEVLRRSTNLSIDAGYLSVPQPVAFPTEQGRTAHALYYPPRNRDFAAAPGELPPLVVRCHGGPTGAATAELRPEIQFWTSRGLAVLDVNYGGSTGHGRAYRERLNGQWGIVDVDDCVNGARFLVERGMVDGWRVAIRGGSAGGYTTLAALTFRSFFKAGASYYGVSDLEALARDTHKFESRYLDRLIGPYPERRDLYRERSPLHYCDRLSCPVILFQGLEDKVVPPNQAERMVSALRAKGLPVAYVPFEGEQHGFRRAGNIKRALDGELYFYGRIFGFELAEPVAPVAIDNL
jgi:dipeptidyl aminopeptidase/acylaminoacyl peptidase